MVDARQAESWDVADVSAFIEEAGYPQYKGTFEGNFINGWKLLSQVTSNSQLISMNITDFAHQRDILAKIKEVRIACGRESPYHIPASLLDNASLLSQEEAELCQALCLTAGQMHLFECWPPLGQDDDEKLRLVAQLMTLHSQYPGGLLQYWSNAVDLLSASAAGTNPFEGLTPSVPAGSKLDFGSEGFQVAENTGMDNAKDAAFVLVAGGLGERLGYGGIKVALPTEITTGKCYLQLYIEHILALQGRARTQNDDDSITLPLAIMTSDDTHGPTAELLQTHDNFGMAPGQITLMKQNKVAALQNNAGHFALKDNDFYSLQTKPHGHGDVHVLLSQHGILDKWAASGAKWIFFFQDTNANCFRTFIACLGVSVLKNLDFNTITVPREAGAAVGAICKLTAEDGSSTTLNVEYNQLDPLLRATVDPAGDVAGEDGLSPYPGNTNQLVVKLAPYMAAMESTGGMVPEFVNPKYKDAAKEQFKAPTRLECMMQDYPKLMAPTAAVGFTTFDAFFYSPVKNNTGDAAAKVAKGQSGACAATGEADFYAIGAKLLGLTGRYETVVAVPTEPPAAEPEAEPVAEPEAEPETELEAEPATEPATEPETEAEAEPETEAEAEPETEAEAEPEADEAAPAEAAEEEPVVEPAAEPTSTGTAPAVESAAQVMEAAPCVVSPAAPTAYLGVPVALGPAGEYSWPVHCWQCPCRGSPHCGPCASAQLHCLRRHHAAQLRCTEKARPRNSPFGLCGQWCSRPPLG
eukprot:COSAG01_NODE_392_length_17668_cov_5.382264_10_plen_752_part_00